MEHSVRLDVLPPNLRFPTDLSDRIAYDEARHRLMFRGFMSKAEFDRLVPLSKDWTYRRALEDLFRLATTEEPARARVPGRLRSMLASLGL